MRSHKGVLLSLASNVSRSCRTGAHIILLSIFVPGWEFNGEGRYCLSQEPRVKIGIEHIWQIEQL